MLSSLPVLACRLRSRSPSLRPQGLTGSLLALVSQVQSTILSPNGQQERSHILYSVVSGVQYHLSLLLLLPTVEVKLYRTCIKKHVELVEACTVLRGLAEVSQL